MTSAVEAAVPWGEEAAPDGVGAGKPDVVGASGPWAIAQTTENKPRERTHREASMRNWMEYSAFGFHSLYGS
jgi:hypothetical protein